jgi:pyruvate/2-oxoglutarate dehydrogenase complex dihydrolipoamide acyltransferase (E2) component
MEMAPVVVGPPAYGSPDPTTSAGRLLPLEQHPLNPENLPEDHPAAISTDYGEGYAQTLTGVETLRSGPVRTDLERDLAGGDLASRNAAADATSGAVDLATAEGVDLSQVEGSGEGGRIVKADVESYLSEQEGEETA